jgi:hypothetical protein
MSEAKTVAIIGAGPVGLAAAAHVLERGLTPIVLESGSQVGHAMRQWGHVQMFSPWEYNIDRAAARLRANRLVRSPGNIRPAPNWWSAISSRSPPRCAAAHSTSSRVTDISRVGFDKSRPQAGRRRHSRSATRTARGPRASARTRSSTLRALGLHPTQPEPTACRRRRDAGGGRIAYGMPDVLGGIARVTQAKPSRCWAAIRRSDADRPPTLATEEPETKPVWLLRATIPQLSAAARTTSRRSRCAWRGLRRAGGGGPDQVESEFRVSHLTGGRLTVGAGSACRGCQLESTNWSWRPARPDLDFVRELRIRSIRRWNARPRWRR